MVGMLAAILVGGLLITCAVKMLPYYIENWNIQSILRDTEKQFTGSASVKKEEIVEKLKKRMYVDMIESISMDEVVVKKEKGAYLVTANYEQRVNLFGNVDVVMVFDNNIAEIPIGAR